MPGSAEADASTLERAEADASTPQSAEADAGTLERAEADAGRFLELVLEQARGNESVRGLIELYTVVCAEATTEGHPGADYFRGRFARLRAGYAAHFTALAACGRLRPGVDPRRAATSLVALWDGLQLQWLLEPEEVDVAQHLSDFLRLVTGEPA
ncbi:TetR/AcrR family transcriptional regulator [Auraticoccus sp. F435]|uniref:TetR/AcrR family transcriptional regulator n=1 Tax=Auraticoccus cholistanensis TaxID=2656650 RepID=A0A6A9UVH6_9ACTN|nr:TetR/AcrR family transcriptional regulator [Auraticoccus cholistanensis]